MKTLLFLFLFLANHALAQYPRGADLAIIYSGDMEDHQLIRECVRILESEGFCVISREGWPLFVQTISNEIHQMPLDFKLEILVSDHLVQGFIRDGRDFEKLGLHPIPQTWEKASYRSFNGSTWRTGFDVVIRMVEKIRAGVRGKVLYDRSPQPTGEFFHNDWLVEVSQ